MSNEFTTMEIMEMLAKFSDRMDQNFFDLEERLNQRFNKVDERFDIIEQRLDYHETRLGRIESNMATKNQLNSLVGILQRNKTISEFEAAHVRHESAGKI